MRFPAVALARRRVLLMFSPFESASGSFSFRDRSSVSPHFRPGPRPSARGRPARRRRLHGRAQSRTAAGGRDHRGAGAGSGGGRHGQDAGPDHAAGAHPGDRKSAAVGAAGGHLHQQGRARDARADHPSDRPVGRGPALAGHLPQRGGPNPASPCGAGGAEIQLHHPGYGRSGTGAEAAAGSGKRRHQAMDAPLLVRDDRPLEEPRLDPGYAPLGRGLRQRQGQGSVRRLSGAAGLAERLRLRRPAAAQPDHSGQEPGSGRGVPAPVQVHSGGRVSGHQCGPVPVAAAAVVLHRQRLLRGR